MIIGSTKGFIRGKALSVEGHTHDTGDLISGVLPLIRGGTGVTSLDALKSSLGISNSGIKVKTGTINCRLDAGESSTSAIGFTPALIIIPEDFSLATGIDSLFVYFTSNTIVDEKLRFYVSGTNLICQNVSDGFSNWNENTEYIALG